MLSKMRVRINLDNAGILQVELLELDLESFCFPILSCSVICTSKAPHRATVHDHSQCGKRENVGRTRKEEKNNEMASRLDGGERADASLYDAAAAGDLARVRATVEASTPVDSRSLNGALMAAVANGHVAVVEYLVNNGANVDARDKGGKSALIQAVDKNQEEAVRLLVECGAEVNRMDKSDRSTPLMHAVWNVSDAAIAQYLVDNGAKLDVRDNKGVTALIYAVLRNQEAVVRLLVESGAKVDRTAEEKRRTPLMIAARGSDGLDIVRFLVDNGANVKARDYKGKTVLMHALVSNRVEVVRLLIERGAKVNRPDRNDGRTPLMHAALVGSDSEIVRYLFDKGAAVDTQDMDDRTALMHAARTGNLDVARSLVECGADVDAVDIKVKTALMYAAKFGRLEIAQLLVEHGADVNMVNGFALNAAYYATRHGYAEIRNLLLPHMQHVRTNLAFTEREHAEVYTTSLTSKSWAIDPFDIELIERFDGGEFRAKWLNADVVVKLYIPDATTVTFAEEITTWYQLRHPNVIKLYGACGVGHLLFVQEYASNGSLVDYLAERDRRGERRTPWKFLHEAALGLAYLHERGIVHGNLRSSNILVGNDGVAKLADFMLTIPTRDTKYRGRTYGSVQWNAPEQGRYTKPSFESDIYSFGLCILAAVSGKTPWKDSTNFRCEKSEWNPADDPESLYAPVPLAEHTRYIASRLCCLSPMNRVAAATVVQILENLAEREANATQTELDLVEKRAVEYANGELIRLWNNLRSLLTAQLGDGPLRALVLEIVGAIDQQLERVYRPQKKLDAFYRFMLDIERAMQSGSTQNRILALSSTRAKGNNLSFLRHYTSVLWTLLDGPRAAEKVWNQRWEMQLKDQPDLFVSEVSHTILVLSNNYDSDDLSAFVAILKAEIDERASTYTEGQLSVIQQALDEIMRENATKIVTSAPVWFLPWYELAIDKMVLPLGEGGFGTVYRAKWLDSEVVVKQVKALEEETDHGALSWRPSWPASIDNVTNFPTANNMEARKKMRERFEREVNVWFDLSHPHVIRLFGACHVGTPFFACEFAGKGSLDKYLQQHPDELWSKLYEASLGLQYLQSRDIIHGDLKCNNIVVGNDGKAKMTDFGLSFLNDSREGSELTGALQWVAPECIENGAAQCSFASDIYSLGMCIVEAMRIVQSIKLKKPNEKYPPPYPFGDLGNKEVKLIVVEKRELPLRPQECTDEQWRLVERMCAYDPEQRIKIGTVVDELVNFARGDVFDEQAEPESEELEPACPVLEKIADMMARSRQFHSDGSEGDQKVLWRIHLLLWERLEDLVSTHESGEDALNVIENLRPLVKNAEKCTLGLSNWKDTLLNFTETSMQCYSLHRSLDKLMDAKLWRSDGQISDIHDWRPKCLDVVTGSAGDEYLAQVGHYLG